MDEALPVFWALGAEEGSREGREPSEKSSLSSPAVSARVSGRMGRCSVLEIKSRGKPVT